MDLSAHFESYRDSLRRDALEGCVEFSKSLPAEGSANAHDLLGHALKVCRTAAQRGDEKVYRDWVKHHQTAMVRLLEKQVSALLAEYSAEVTWDLLYDMIAEKGWRWFKFAPKSLEMTLNVNDSFKPRMMWLPRWTKTTVVRPGVAAFDADEMELIMSAKPGHGTVHSLIVHKQSGMPQKLLHVRPGHSYCEPIDQINVDGLVRDWTMPLFQTARKR